MSRLPCDGAGSPLPERASFRKGRGSHSQLEGLFAGGVGGQCADQTDPQQVLAVSKCLSHSFCHFVDPLTSPMWQKKNFFAGDETRRNPVPRSDHSGRAPSSCCGVPVAGSACCSGAHAAALEKPQEKPGHWVWDLSGVRQAGLRGCSQQDVFVCVTI